MSDVSGLVGAFGGMVGCSLSGEIFNTSDASRQAVFAAIFRKIADHAEQKDWTTEIILNLMYELAAYNRSVLVVMQK